MGERVDLMVGLRWVTKSYATTKSVMVKARYSESTPGHWICISLANVSIVGISYHTARVDGMDLLIDEGYFDAFMEAYADYNSLVPESSGEIK